MCYNNKRKKETSFLQKEISYERLRSCSPQSHARQSTDIELLVAFMAKAV